MNDAETRERLDDETAPPQRWRNLFECERPISTQRNGDVGPGQFLGSMKFWSAEEARAQARIDMARDFQVVIESGVKYLGPVAVDENGDPERTRAARKDGGA